MAQDADNDNGTRSAIDAIRASAPNWTNYGPGGTALAASPPADRAPDAPAHASAEQDDAGIDPTATEQSSGSDDGERDSAAQSLDRSAPALPQDSPPVPRFTVTDAASLAELGVELPQRPMPRRADTKQISVPLSNPVHSPAVPTPTADDHQRSSTQRPSSPTGPLFNTPPQAPTSEQADAFAQAAFSSANSGNRNVTSQPGFLLGLVSAAIVGAALYIYLT